MSPPQRWILWRSRRFICQFNDLALNKTALYISHRMSSSRFCDHVVVFDGGQIAEYGTHTELMKQDGLYAEMYRKQAQYYVDVK